jgi:hypothetical protein
MIPQSFIYRLDPICLAIVARCDLVQGDHGRPAAGFVRVSEAIGTKADTVRAHVIDHLVPLGVIELRQSAGASAELVVIHNPARGRINPTSPIAPVDRKCPPRRGTRAGHRGRRPPREQLPVQRETVTRSTGNPAREQLPDKRVTALGLTRCDLRSDGTPAVVEIVKESASREVVVLRCVDRDPVSGHECGAPADGRFATYEGRTVPLCLQHEAF